MQVDRYTKFILTVIAACLLWLCLRSNIPTSPAYGDTPNSVQDVRIVSIVKPPADKDWSPVNVYDVRGR